MRRLLRNEPTLLIGLAKAALIAAVAFGLPIDGDQQAALLGLAAAVLALSGVNRQVVIPVAKVPQLGRVVDTAADEAGKILDALDPDKEGST